MSAFAPAWAMIALVFIAFCLLVLVGIVGQEIDDEAPIDKE